MRYPFFLNERDKSKLVPGTIFQLAQTNSVLATTIKLWQNGFYSWEQMLIHCILCLDEYYDDLSKKLMERPRPVVIEYTGKDELFPDILKQTGAKPNRGDNEQSTNE